MTSKWLWAKRLLAGFLLALVILSGHRAEAGVFQHICRFFGYGWSDGYHARSPLMEYPVLWPAPHDAPFFNIGPPPLDDYHEPVLPPTPGFAPPPPPASAPHPKAERRVPEHTFPQRPLARLPGA